MFECYHKLCCRGKFKCTCCWRAIEIGLGLLRCVPRVVVAPILLNINYLPCCTNSISAKTNPFFVRLATQ